MKTFLSAFSLILLFCLDSSAQQLRTVRDTLQAQITFRQGYSQVDAAFDENRTHLDRLVRQLDSLASDPLITLKSVAIKGSASPEGYSNMNRRLSEKRALNLRAYITAHTSLRDSLVTIMPSDVDWERLAEMVAACDRPWRDEALDIIAHTPVWIFEGRKIVGGRKQRLCRLRGGEAWKYMFDHFFPALRNARYRIVCEWETAVAEDENDAAAVTPPAEAEPAVPAADSTFLAPVLPERDSLPAEAVAAVPEAKKSRRPAPPLLLKTNLLYDAVAIPNGGLEIAVADKWSVSADWMGAWWSNHPERRYWRIYGGDVEVKYNIGKSPSAPNPFIGHHVGAYVSLLSYDIQSGLKHRGVLSARYNYAVGVSYNYTYPLSRSFGIDFSVGVGYLWGYYKKHRPIDDHDVWISTHRLHWFGPTRVGVSLFWILSGKNQAGKGGAR